MLEASQSVRQNTHRVFDGIITILGVLEFFLLPRLNLELGLGSLRQFRSDMLLQLRGDRMDT